MKHQQRKAKGRLYAKYFAAMREKNISKESIKHIAKDDSNMLKWKEVDPWFLGSCCMVVSLIFLAYLHCILQ